MKKDRIFFKSAICFLLAAGIAVSLTAAEPNREPLIVSGEGGNIRNGELQLLYRHLASLYHINPRRSPVTLEIVLSPAIPAGQPEITTSGKPWIAAINSDPGAFADSASLRRYVYTVMLMAAAGIDVPDGRGLSLIPSAAFLGLDAIMKGWHGPERWVRGNRRLNVLRALLGAKALPPPGKWLPEAAEMPEYLSPAAYIWCSELARSAVESSSRSFFTRSRLAGYFSPEYDSDMDLIIALAGGADRAVRKFRQQSVRLAWSEFNPRPAGLTLQELADWRKLTVDELDKDGKPTGKSSKMDIAQVIPLLRKRPDAFAIITAAADALMNLSNGDTREFKAAAAETARSIMALKDRGYPERADSLLKEIAVLSAITRQRLTIDSYLDGVAAAHTPLNISHGVRLKTVRSKPGAASAAIDGYLDKVAASF